MDLSHLTPAQKREALFLLEEKRRLTAENKFFAYQPYPKQKEFHASMARETMLLAANQIGKSYAHAYHIAAHMTGRYPDWWEGRRFSAPTVGWVCGVSGIGVRDALQRILVGRPGEYGTGLIPKKYLVDVQSARGVPDLLDSFTVRHVGGGVSSAGIKSYEQGREKFQSETLDWAALDEEPPLDIYTEVLTRTNTTMGPITMTFTPLLGMSDVVKRYLVEKVPGTAVVRATLDDAEHYTPEQRLAIVAQYPEHERKARALGIPVLGSGVVFPVAESEITVEAFPLPPHWPRLCAIDFGWDHPFAAVWIAWDRESDTVYVYDCYRERNALPSTHAAAIAPRGRWIQIVWPADGLASEKGTGKALAEIYRGLQLNMMDAPFRRADGTVSVESGITDMLEAMRARRFKVFGHLLDWFEEFRLYHRKDGKIHKVGEDLMSATRYAFDMRHEARTEAESAAFAGLNAFQGNWAPPVEAWTPFDSVIGY